MKKIIWFVFFGLGVVGCDSSSPTISSSRPTRGGAAAGGVAVISAPLTLLEWPKGGTMEPLIELLNGYRPEQIFIGFDVDGTLTNLAPPPLKKTPDERLRGGAQTRAVFDLINAQEIKWFAISGRSASISSAVGVATSIYGLGLTFPAWSTTNNCLQGTLGDGSPKFRPTLITDALSFLGGNYNAIECNNIVSALEPGAEFATQKQAGIDFAINKYFPTYPDLIIFVDDSAEYLMNVYEYFKVLNRPGLHFVGVLFYPDKPEAGHLARLDEFLAEKLRLFQLP